jgi:hypothetical protein
MGHAWLLLPEELRRSSSYNATALAKLLSLDATAGNNFQLRGCSFLKILLGYSRLLYNKSPNYLNSIGVLTSFHLPSLRVID